MLMVLWKKISTRGMKFRFCCVIPTVDGCILVDNSSRVLQYLIITDALI